MAARLLEIKAKALLPKSEDEQEDTEDLQARLVRQLVEYKILKRSPLFCFAGTGRTLCCLSGS